MKFTFTWYNKLITSRLFSFCFCGLRGTSTDSLTRLFSVRDVTGKFKLARTLAAWSGDFRSRNSANSGSDLYCNIKITKVNWFGSILIYFHYFLHETLQLTTKQMRIPGSKAQTGVDAHGAIFIGSKKE